MASLKRIFFLVFFFVVNLACPIKSYAISKEALGEEYRLSGQQAKQKGEYYQALSFYIKATSLGVLNPSLYNDMGVLYEEIGFDQKAEEAYIQAIKIKKDYLPAYSNLAFFYKKQGQLDKAFEFFKLRYELSQNNDPWSKMAKDEMLKIDPEYNNVLLKQEASKFEQEVVAKNREEFYRQIKIAAEHYRKGQKFAQKSDYKNAIREFNQSLAIAPRNPQVLKAKRQAITELSKLNMQKHYAKAYEMMRVGNARSARNEIQQLLSTIPDGVQP